MRLDAFRPTADFKANMDQWIQRFRSATPVDGAKQIVIPGDPERALEKERLENGLELMDSVVDDLKKVGDGLGVGFVS